SAPVSRAIAAISATIRARSAARGSCASEGWVCVTASRKSAESRTASMSRPGSGDHQAGQALRIGEQIRARTAVSAAAAVQHERSLRDSKGDLRMLLDEHDRKRILLDESLQGLQQHFDDDGREPFERLVHEQERRVAHQRAPDGEHLLLAAGDLVAPVVAPLGELREEIVDPLEGPAARTRRDVEVLLDRERRKDVACLRDQADAAAGTRADGQLHDRLLPVLYASRVKSRVPHDRLEQRGLAYPVPAEDRERTAFGQ